MAFWDEVVERARKGDKEAIELLEAYDEAGKKISEKFPIADDPSV